MAGKRLGQGRAIGLLLVILTACTRNPGEIERLKATETAAPITPIQPTQAAIPSELAFSAPLVRSLTQSGIRVLDVQESTYMSMFNSTDKAVWIKTDKGIVEAVFFLDAAEATRIHVTQQPMKTAGRYVYIIEAPTPTLLNPQTIDAAFPLYFTIGRGMFMETSSAELDKALKQVVSGP